MGRLQPLGVFDNPCRGEGDHENTFDHDIEVLFARRQDSELLRT